MSDQEPGSLEFKTCESYVAESEFVLLCIQPEDALHFCSECNEIADMHGTTSLAILQSKNHHGDEQRQRCSEFIVSGQTPVWSGFVCRPCAL